MAQQINFTSNQVPGSLSVTGNPADSNSHPQSADGRCPRCERMRWEIQCPGVAGAFNHLGS
jgi:hypothetical protein